MTVDCLKNLSDKSVWKYIRTTTPPGVAVDSKTVDSQSYDLDEFDFGMINIWTQGQAAAGQALCDVFMDFHWELKEANSSSLISAPVPVVDGLTADVWEQDAAPAFCAVAASGTPALTAAGMILASDMKADPDNTLNCVVAQGGTNYQITFAPPNPGFYLAVGTITARTVGGASAVTWAWNSDPANFKYLPLSVNTGGATVLTYDIFFDVGTGTTNQFSKNANVRPCNNLVGASTQVDSMVAICAFEVVTNGDYVIFDISGFGATWQNRSDDIIPAAGNGYYGTTFCISELPPSLTRMFKKKTDSKKSDESVKAEIAELRELVLKLLQSRGSVSSSVSGLAALGESKTPAGEKGKDDKSEPQSKPRSSSTESIVLVDAVGNTTASTPALAAAVAAVAIPKPAAAASEPKGTDRKKQVDVNTKKK